MSSRRLFLVSLLTFAMLSTSFAAKRSKADLDTDIRKAITEAGFRHEPVTVEAEVETNKAFPTVTGKYRLMWRSKHDWLERIDVLKGSSLTIGKGDRQYRTSTLVGDVFAFAIGEAFDPEKFWYGGGDWKIESVGSQKLNGVSAECASYERIDKRRGEFEACIDPASKDLLKISSKEVAAFYSKFETFNARRVPRRVQVAVAIPANHIELNVTRITSDATVPEPHAGMQEQPNCTASEVTGGKLVNHVAPRYPESAKSMRQQGAVVLGTEILADGTVAIRSVLGGPSKDLSDATVEAVKKWRYSPYVCNGSAIPVETVISIDFTLGG